MHAQKQIHHSTLLGVTSMAATSLIFISLLIFTSSTTSSTAPLRPPSTPVGKSSSHQIRQACKATRNPQLCESSLGHSPSTNPMEIIQWALSLSSDNLRIARSNVLSILKSFTGDSNRTTAIMLCLEHLRHSDYRLKSVANALRRKRIKDGRAWTSAILTHPHGCRSALSYVNDTKLVVDTISLLDTLIGYISNALSMMMAYDVFGDKTAYWRPPKTERDGFWEHVVASAGGEGKRLGVPAGLKADVTVCKGGGCKFTTLQDAVNATPNWDRRRQFVILVKAGVYKETIRVGFEKQNVVVLGEGMGKTVITGSLNVGQPGMSTYHSATVAVLGDGFMASNLTIANTAGPGTGQAVAFRSESDQSIIENCEFLGNQDTLYLHSLRQYFKSCHIQGNVDFIFGNAATIFEDCTIMVRPRQLTPEKGEKNAVTAHARNDPAQTTGFVFHNCLVNGTEEYMKLYHINPNVHKNYLGRPWREFSRTVFIGCTLEALISPQGWMPWTGYSALKTLYYGEFNNSGKGSDMSGRVEWSSRIPAEHVHVYSITNFIQGHEWRLTY